MMSQVLQCTQFEKLICMRLPPPSAATISYTAAGQNFSQGWPNSSAQRVTQMFVSLPNFAELNSLPYMHTVIPNLRNLGLITERTSDKWKQLGMMVDSAAGVKGVKAAS